MAERSVPKKLNYILQVKQQLEQPFNDEQEITVQVVPSLIPELYKLLAYQQGLYTENQNPVIKQRLFEQLVYHPELTQELLDIAANHTVKEEDHIKVNGIDYLEALEL